MKRCASLCKLKSGKFLCENRTKVRRFTLYRRGLFVSISFFHRLPEPQLGDVEHSVPRFAFYMYVNMLKMASRRSVSRYLEFHGFSCTIATNATKPLYLDTTYAHMRLRGRMYIYRVILLQVYCPFCVYQISFTAEPT